MQLMDLLRRPFESENLAALRFVDVPNLIEVKLLHLAALADLARSENMAIAEEVRDAHQDQRALDEQLTRWREFQARNPHALPRLHVPDLEPRRDAGSLAEPFGIERSTRNDVSAEVPALEARLAGLTRALERLRPRHAAIGARCDALGRLSSRCVEWAKPMTPGALAAAVAKSAATLKGYRLPRDPRRLPAELDAVRAELAALTTQRATIASTKVTLAEAKERALAILDGITAGWTFNVASFFDPRFEAQYFRDGSGIAPHHAAPADIRAFFTTLLADKLRDTVVALLEQEAQGHTVSLTDAERTQRLEALDVKAELLGLKEEALIMATENDGRQADRREDADPLCVLTAPVLEAA